MTTKNIEELAFSSIAAHADIQPRAEMNSEVIAEYEEAMRKGEEFPPVIVFKDNNAAFHWLADGFHRYHAAKQVPGKSTIQCDVREGGKKEAILCAIGANADHGLRRTNADKRRAVDMALKLTAEEGEQPSDGEIARRCRVSQPFVSKLRRESTQNSFELTTVRKGTDGRVRNTGNIGRRKQYDSAPDEIHSDIIKAIKNGEVDCDEIPVRLASTKRHLKEEKMDRLARAVALFRSFNEEEKQLFLNTLGLVERGEQVDEEDHHCSADSEDRPWIVDPRKSDEFVEEETKALLETAAKMDREGFFGVAKTKSRRISPQILDQIDLLNEQGYSEEEMADELAITIAQVKQAFEDLYGKGSLE